MVVKVPHTISSSIIWVGDMFSKYEENIPYYPYLAILPLIYLLVSYNHGRNILMDKWLLCSAISLVHGAIFAWLSHPSNRLSWWVRFCYHCCLAMIISLVVAFLWSIWRRSTRQPFAHQARPETPPNQPQRDSNSPQRESTSKNSVRQRKTAAPRNLAPSPRNLAPSPRNLAPPPINLPENATGVFLPLVVTLSGIFLWMVFTQPKEKLLSIFWYGYLFHYSYGLLALSILFPAIRVSLGQRYYTAATLVLGMVMITLAWFMGSISWGLLSCLSLITFSVLELYPLDVMKFCMRSAIIVGAGYQIKLLLSYCGSHSFWMELVVYTGGSPFMTLDYMICSLALMHFFWIHQERFSAPELFGLLAGTLCFCGDISFALFCLRVPVEVAMKKFDDYRRWWSFRNLLVPTVVVFLLAWFFYIRLPFLVPQPTMGIFVAARLSVIGSRMLIGILTIGINMMVYAYPGIKLQINFNGNKHDVISDLSTRFCQLWSVSLISHVLFPIPLFISMGLGRSSFQVRGLTWFEVIKLCFCILLMSMFFQADPLVYAWVTVSAWYLIRDEYLSFVATIPCIVSVIAPTETYCLLIALFLALVQILPDALEPQRNTIKKFLYWITNLLPALFLLFAAKTVPGVFSLLLPFANFGYKGRLQSVWWIIPIVQLIQSLHQPLTDVGFLTRPLCRVQPPAIPNTVLWSSIMQNVTDRLAVDPIERGQHLESYGCMLGEFQVEDPSIVPVRFRHGIFEEFKTHPVEMRFSAASGDTTLPSNGVKGLALKIKDFGKEPLVDFERVFNFKIPSDQDFLFINRAKFFISDEALRHYDVLDDIKKTMTTSAAKAIWNTLRWLFDGFLESIDEFWARWEILQNIFDIARGPVDDPYKTNYSSTTPYALVHDGQVQAVVRYELRTVACTDDTKACFEFWFREQVDECDEPVGDSTKEWSGNRVRVGKIIFPLESQGKQCDLMSFNPWHTSKELVPLGAVNQERLVTYAAAEYRRQATMMSLFNESARGTPEKPAGDDASYVYEQYPDFPDLHKYPILDLIGPHILTHLPADGVFLAKAAQVTGLVKDLAADANWPDHGHLKSFKQFSDVFNRNLEPLPTPGVLLSKKRNWQEDSVFAQQYLSGIHPGQLCRLSWDNFPRSVSPEQLLNVTQLSKNSTILFVDYLILEGIHRAAGAVLYDGIVFFELLKKELIPVAIQLTRNGSNDRIYTPRDKKYVWLFAKMHILQSDSTVHEFISHLGNTHLSAEGVLTATRRALSGAHPLRLLFEPHFEQLLSINQFGRNTLLSTRGPFHQASALGTKGVMQLMARATRSENFTLTHSFPTYLTRGGLTKDDLLTGISKHYYAEDGMRLWDINCNYSKDLVSLFWSSDEDVHLDSGIQMMYRELVSGLLAAIKGIPDFRRSRANLAEFVCQVVYMNTQEHASFNNLQYEMMAFIPGRPLKLVKPIKEDITEDYILRALPTSEEAKTTIEVVRTLSFPTFAPLLASRLRPRLRAALPTPELKTLYDNIVKNYRSALADMDRDVEARSADARRQGEEYPFVYNAIQPVNVSVSIDI